MLRVSKEQSTTSRNISSVSDSVRKKPLIQTKLTIGKSNDKYEAEADRVADKVVKGSGPGIQKKCAGCEQEEAQKKPIIQKMEEEEAQAKPAQRIMKMEEEEEAQPKLNDSIQKQGKEEELQPKLINGIQRKGEEEEEAQPKLMPGIQKQEEEEPVQAKKDAGGKQVASSDVSGKIHKSKGQGGAMDKGTRSFMESRFGADFGNVRIHNDSNSHQLSKKLNAQAFTVGNDIYFNKGKYNPTSSSGKHLLAHELTHTIQQKGAKTIQKQDAGGSSTPKIDWPTKKPFEDTFDKALGSFTLDHFDSGKSDLTGSHVTTISEHVATIQFLFSQDPKAYIVVEGHTDAVDSEDFNETLSKQRAESVAAELVNQGIPQFRILTKGKGESQLKVKTKKGNATNRRVEILFSKPAFDLGVDTQLKVKDFSLEEIERKIKEKEKQLKDLLDFTPTPEQIEKWKWEHMEQVYKDLKPVDNDLTLNDAIDRIIDKATEGVGDKTVRKYLRKAIRGAVDKGIDAGLDEALDAAGIEGEGRQAIKESIKVLREHGLKKHKDAP